MKRTIAAFAGALALVAAAPIAQAAPAKSPTQRIAALEKQVAALQKETKRLNGEIQSNYFGDACLASLTSDAIQGTWAVLNTFAGRVLFTVGTAVSDKQGCQVASTTRSPNNAAGYLTALTMFINWLV